MKLSSEIAQLIVEETAAITNKNINIMDQEGLIIASIDRERIGTFHEAAWRVMKMKEQVIVSKEDKLKGTKPGINLPIHFGEDVIGVIGITGLPEDVVQIGRLIKKMTEMMVRESAIVNQQQLESKARENFINQWISGHWENDEQLASRGSLLGINVTHPRVAIIINTHLYKKGTNKNINDELDTQKTINEIVAFIEDLFNHPQLVVWYWSSYKIVILYPVHTNDDKLKREQKLERELSKVRQSVKHRFKIEISVGIGNHHPHQGGVSKSFKEAEHALAFTNLRSEQQESLLFYDQLGIELLMTELSKKTQRDFIQRILGDKELEQDSQLMRTLKTFLDQNQSIIESANQLFVHKNTLQYRLRKIKDITGYDPRKFSDAVLFQIALTFYKNIN